MEEERAKKYENFIDLITNCKIRVPIIQRDYVQGSYKEKEGNTLKTEVKDYLLNDIFDVLANNVERMSLDFIYGKIENEDGIKVFEPIDGQQRLTTLFLLTYFVIMKDTSITNKKEILENFQEFSYAVRNSSKEFCLEFCEFCKNNKDIPNLKVKDFIMKQKWFDENWINDETIMSMLEMLESIGEKYDKLAKEGKKNLYSRIRNVEFKFINTNLNDVKLDNDTYIKLNARGIKLSTFEKYKNKFLKFFEGTPNYIELSKNIDKDWSDWIWKKIDKEEYEKNNRIFDNAFIRIFRAILIGEHISSYPINKENKAKYNEVITNLQMNFFEKQDEFKDSKEVIKRLQNFMNFIAKSQIDDKEELNAYIDFKQIIDKLIQQKEVGYVDLLEFYSIYLYGSNNEKLDKENYMQWTRIARNLLVKFCEDSIMFSNFIQGITHIFNIVNTNQQYLVNFLNQVRETDNVYTGYLKQQIPEEKNKIRVMQLQSVLPWKEKIEEVDKNIKTIGLTEFLLEFCGIEDVIQTNNFQYEKECFERYEKLISLFNIIFDSEKDSEIINPELADSNELLARALLTYNNEDERNLFDAIYLSNVGRYYTFFKNTQERDFSWRNLLRDRKKRRNLKKLMDTLINNEYFMDINQVKEGLKKIIDKETKEIKDWRRYFIKDNHIFSLLCNGNNWVLVEKQKDIFLIKKRIPSLCLPFVIYAIVNQMNYSYKINENYSSIEDTSFWIPSPFGNYDMKITQINGKEVLIQVKYKEDGKFHYYKDIENLDEEKEEIAEILNKIESEFNIEFELV